MCGVEGILLALTLAQRLVGQPWQPFYPWTTSEMLTIPHTVAPHWLQLRKQADNEEARNRDLQDFHNMVRMCKPESGADGKPFAITGHGTIERLGK